VTKKERIAQLEREVAELKREVEELKACPPSVVYAEKETTDHDNRGTWVKRQSWESYPTCVSGRITISQ
jgi:hypothetical protein